MKNKWKIAFWTIFSVFVLTTTFLVYGLINQAYTITYMREGYEDTEHDLEQISEVIKGKLTFRDFKQISDRYPDLDDSTHLDLNRTRIVFGSDAKIKKVTTNW